MAATCRLIVAQKGRFERGGPSFVEGLRMPQPMLKNVAVAIAYA